MIFRLFLYLAMLSVAAFFGAGAWLCYETWTTEHEIADSVQAVADAAAALPGVADTHLAALEEKVDAVTAIARTLAGNADKRTGQALDIVATAESDSRNLLDLKLTDFNSQLTSANKTLGAAADGINFLTSKYAELPDQVSGSREFKSYVANGLGLLAAAKLTAGQTEKTMAAIDLATPHILANVDAFTASGVQASQKTTLVMSNFAVATKPLPTWMRIGLAVAPPAAQALAGAATAWTLIH
jgi:hypothetical protein